eukprot:scaffold2262_cov312-Prasinococcus_capsulatus_cf.AAC.10
MCASGPHLASPTLRFHFVAYSFTCGCSSCAQHATARGGAVVSDNRHHRADAGAPRTRTGGARPPQANLQLRHVLPRQREVGRVGVLPVPVHDVPATTSAQRA